jgi:hypothetical protein
MNEHVTTVDYVMEKSTGFMSCKEFLFTYGALELSVIDFREKVRMTCSLPLNSFVSIAPMAYF